MLSSRDIASPPVIALLIQMTFALMKKINLRQIDNTRSL